MTDDRLDRMGAFDAVMWGVEQDPLLRSVIVAMTILDAPPDMDVLLDRVNRMSKVNDKLRRRVIGNPMSIIPPRWELDPNFDLSYHVRRYRVASDGTDTPLLRIAEQMGEQDFDRDRPLWEMAVVEGFDGEKSAVIIKLHHAITDGVGGMAMAATLFDFTRTPTDPGPDEADPEGEQLGLAGRIANGLQFGARQVVKRGTSAAGQVKSLATHAVTAPTETASEGAAFAQSAARLLAPASEPLSSLMTGRSLAVRMVVLQMPFRDLKAAAKAAGGTINDAYVAAVSGGLSTYHQAHGNSSDSVRINMPINVRSDGPSDNGGNRWVPARFALPLDSGDPTQRIRKLGPLLLQARTEPALRVSDTVYRLLAALPQSVTTSISAGMMKGCDLAVTNVPGPPIPLYTAGAAVEAIVPFAPKAGAAANFGLMTYNGIAFVGLNIDTRAIPDAETFIEHVVAGFEEILALAGTEAKVRVGVHS
jgi:diacylglycerol O-acyltransferase